MIELQLTMPVIKSASKKLRQSLKKRDANRMVKKNLKDLMDGFKKKPTSETFTKLMSVLDKAAKINAIHKNKAARLKSRLSKKLVKEKPVTPKKTAPKKAKK